MGLKEEEGVVNVSVVVLGEGVRVDTCNRDDRLVGVIGLHNKDGFWDIMVGDFFWVEVQEVQEEEEVQEVQEVQEEVLLCFETIMASSIQSLTLLLDSSPIIILSSFFLSFFSKNFILFYIYITNLILLYSDDTSKK